MRTSPESRSAISEESKSFQGQRSGLSCALSFLPSQPSRKDSPKLLRSTVTVFSRASSVLAALQPSARLGRIRVPTSTPLRSDSLSSLGHHSQHSFVSLLVSWMAYDRLVCESNRAPQGAGDEEEQRRSRAKSERSQSSDISTHPRARAVIYRRVLAPAESDSQPRADSSMRADATSTSPLASSRTGHISIRRRTRGMY